MSATATKSVKKSATLASMAASAKSEPAAGSAVAAPALPVQEAFNWDSLPPARVVVYTRNESVAVDRETSTPSFIKNKVMEAYQATVGVYTDAVTGRTSPAGELVWFWQECGTPERAVEFMNLARKYAAFKGFTLRSKANDNKPSEAAFVVKEKESRPKKPVAKTA